MQGLEHWHSSLGPNMSVATSEGKEGEEVPQGPWMKSHVLRLFTGVVFLPWSPAAFSAVLCITGSDGCSHHITTSSQQTIARGGEQLPRTEQATSLLWYGSKIWRNQFISGTLAPSWALCTRTYFLIWSSASVLGKCMRDVKMNSVKTLISFHNIHWKLVK